MGYAKFFSRSHDPAIRGYDDAGDMMETREHKAISKSGLGSTLFNASNSGSDFVELRARKDGLVVSS